jgi:hypothetical protein
MPERCGPCGKRIGFRKRFFVCKNCAAVCHKECRNEVSVSCNKTKQFQHVLI